MKLKELILSIATYDKHISRADLSHDNAIGELKESVKEYKRARNAVDMFQSPKTYKVYADRVRSLEATIKHLQNL